MKANRDALALLGFLALAVGYTVLQFLSRDEGISFRQAVITTLAVWVLAAAAASIFTVLALLLKRSTRGERLIARFIPWAAVAGVIFGSVVIGPQLDQPGVLAYAIAIAPGALLAALMLAVSIVVARGHGV